MRHVIPIDTASIPASDSTTQTATFTFAFLPKVKVNDSFRNLKKDFKTYEDKHRDKIVQLERDLFVKDGKVNS